jgi:CRP-like cAMP-binding protein
MLTVIEKVDELQKLAFFEAVRTESLAQLAAVAHESNYEAGQLLYAESQPAESMFVVLDGEIELTRNGQPCAKIGPHELTGALPMLSGQPHPETATAATNTRALVIDEQDFFDTVADDFNFTRGVMRALARFASSDSI